MVEEAIDDFDDPSEGNPFDLDANWGGLLLFWPKEKKTVPTQEYGDKEVTVSDVANVDSGEEIQNAYIFPLKLQGALRGNVGNGRPVLGRLQGGSRNAKGDVIRNPSRDEKAWTLTAATLEEKRKAKDFINRRPVADDPSGDAPPF